MARKKQEFDPLAGPIGGSGLRKKKSKGKSFDVLGGGFGGEHPVEKESFDSYADVSFGGSSDALMETGGSSSKSKPKKKGLFASIFGSGKKNKQQKPRKENMPLEAEEERPTSYVPKHVRDPELEIQDGVMETGIADRMVDSAYDGYDEPEYGEQYEEPVSHHQHAGGPEEDLFEEEEIVPSPVRKPVEKKMMPVSAPVRTVAPPPSPAVHRKSPQAASPTAAEPDMHVCHLCGAVSSTEFPQFGSGSGEYVPLCRTCYRAVTTLIKFRDPEDEQEIKSEWYTLCPNLDSDRADGVIAEARNNS
ncbi:MAG: hypothetical protein LBL85_01695 [Methanocalculaceae archaeon]|jgi:hypothetical protein|nr:hypothetical protein [Methanocalculaceae archaeon]